MRARRAAVVLTLALAGGACGRSAAPEAACQVEHPPGGEPVIVCRDGTRAPLPGPAAGCRVVTDGAGLTEVACADGSRVRLGGTPPGGGCRLEGDGEARRVRCADGTDVPLGNGANGGSCDVTRLEPGVRSIRCPDGSGATIHDGIDGVTCAVVDHGDGTRTVACEDGTLATVSAGEPGSVCDLQIEEGARVLVCPDGSRAVISAGSTGSGCDVRVEPHGRNVIRCVDGTEVQLDPGTDAEACTFEAAAGGRAVVECPGGAHVVVEPGRAAPGEIAGAVRLWREPDPSGVAVRVPSLGLETTADGTGAFVLAGVPAGVHEVELAHPGYARVRIGNVIVLGGTTRLDEVELRHAELIATTPMWPPYTDYTQVLPIGDAVLFLEWLEGDRVLALRDLRTGELRRLVNGAYHFVVSGDERRLLVVGDPDTRRELSLLDLGTGASTVLDDDVYARATRFLDGGRHALYVRGPEEFPPYGAQPGYGGSGGGSWPPPDPEPPMAPFPWTPEGELVVTELATGIARAQVPSACAGPALQDRWLVYVEGCTSSASTVLLDLVTGIATTHGRGARWLVPSPDERRVAILRAGAGSGELVVVDVATGTETLLTSSARAWPWGVWRPDGRMFAYSDSAGAYAWDAQSGATTSLGPGLAAAFSPDSAHLLITIGGSRDLAASLALWDGGTNPPSLLPTTGDPLESPWSPDGSRFYMSRPDAGGVDRELLELELASGAETVIGTTERDPRAAVGPGGAVFFHESPGPSYTPRRLVMWDPRTASRTIIADDVNERRPIWESAAADRTRILVPAVTRVGAATPTYRYATWLWDADGAGLTLVCEDCWDARFQSASRVVFRGTGVGLALYDIEAGTTLVLDDRADHFWTGDDFVAYLRRPEGHDATKQLFLLRLP